MRLRMCAPTTDTERAAISRGFDRSFTFSCTSAPDSLPSCTPGHSRCKVPLSPVPGSGPLRAALQGALTQETSHQLIGKTPLLHDCIKGFLHLRNATIFDERACLELVPDDDGRCECDGLVFAREQAEHRHIVDFGKNNWTNSGELHNAIEPGADTAIEAGEKHGLGPQVLREAKFPLAAARMSHEADGLFIQQVIAEWRPGVTRRHAVGQNHVESMRLELREQITHRAGAHDELDVVSSD